MATTADEYKEIGRRISEEAFSEGDHAVIDEYVAEGCVVHNPSLPERVVGRDGYKQFVETVRSAFPDLESTTEELIAEDDKVVERHVATGTHEGEFMGIEATGKQVEAQGISILEFENGQIVEIRGQADMLGLLEQLGVVEPPTE